MEEKILNEKESLKLISIMIQNSQQRIKAKSGMPFLIFGYTTFFISLIVYFSIRITQNQLSNIAWLGIPLIGFSLLYMTTKRKTKYSKTYVDRVVNSIWTVTGSGIFLVSFASSFTRVPVLPILILILGIATTITGMVIKFKPVTMGGIVGMASFILFFIIPGYEQALIYGTCVFIMMVVPGHILNYKGQKENV